jgi:hypothetical protein
MLRRLEGGGIVPLPAGEWESVSGLFEAVHSRDTLVSGMITLLRHRAGYAVMEEPGPDELVLRGFADEESARGFLAERMDTYERMWAAKDVDFVILPDHPDSLLADDSRTGMFRNVQRKMEV